MLTGGRWQQVATISINNNKNRQLGLHPKVIWLNMVIFSWRWYIILSYFLNKIYARILVVLYKLLENQLPQGVLQCVCTTHLSTFWNYIKFTSRKLEYFLNRHLRSTGTFDRLLVESTTRKHGLLNSRQPITTRSLLYVSAPLDGGHRVCCDGLQYLRLYSLGSRLCCNSTSGRVWKYEIGCKTRVFSIKRFQIDTTQVPELHCHAEKTKAK